MRTATFPAKTITPCPRCIGHQHTSLLLSPGVRRCDRCGMSYRVGGVGVLRGRVFANGKRFEATRGMASI
ncbi:MAG: hypothetical protein LLG00_16630 [Planctomycetaceae bacterium]|nr:hypothetical protein [Planctomycetaceae bacterium]